MDNINEKLPKILGWELSPSGTMYTRDPGTGSDVEFLDKFDYKDPAIRCECEDWLLRACRAKIGVPDHMSHSRTISIVGCVYKEGVFIKTFNVSDDDIYKVIAMARIKAGEGE